MRSGSKSGVFMFLRNDFASTAEGALAPHDGVKSIFPADAVDAPVETVPLFTAGVGEKFVLGGGVAGQCGKRHSDETHTPAAGVLPAKELEHSLNK